ncbi:snakin-2 [Canna indica]|uniref:Snakin-2 n=1 Tax=Canna indica TaxID=4628 RepID=A0AAQ3L6X3_9LILI|nr:snakin-2 [Canna indica]
MLEDGSTLHQCSSTATTPLGGAINVASAQCWSMSSIIEEEKAVHVPSSLVKIICSVKRLKKMLSQLENNSRDCAGLCGARCSQHSRPNLCMRACGTCCFRCKCVPPGTSGNREMCGSCYTDMTTHGNRTKCP